LRKSIIKKIRKIEQRTFQPKWRVVVKDFDGLYRGECGEGLSQEQFDVWANREDKDTQVIIVEFNENMPAAPFEKETLTLKVENHLDKNTTDFLRDYEEIIKISRNAETEIIAKSVEDQVSSVDPNCGCFTAEQAKLIAQAQEIINAPIH
jgi:sulfate adenylyltransferase subunit 1 (EFTu-like GTPase family)